jgi:putative ABC transport system permease protein
MPPSNRVLRWLVRLFPEEMRASHGDEMLQILRARHAETPHGTPRLRFWAAILTDVLRSAPRLHFEAIAQDVWYGLRGLTRSPAFATAALLTIALGTGATSAIFTVVNSVLLKPLPYHDANRLALVWATEGQGRATWLSAPEVDDLSRHAKALDGVAGLMDLRFALTGSGTPEEVQLAGASADFFPLLGVHATIGRVFDRSDDREGGPEVVVLAHDFWRRRFGGSPSIVGKAIVLDGRPYTVVGILPASFSIVPPSTVFPAKVDAWVPLQPHLPSRSRDVRFLHVVARIRRGVDLRQANDELTALGIAVSRQFSSAYQNRDVRFHAVPLQDDVVREVRPALVLLIAIVALVLAIACANIAALQLARGEGRRREMAVRAALGASRGRLLRQLLAEGALLASLGTIGGLALASLTPLLTRSPVLARLPRFGDVSMDSRMIWFAIGLAAITTLVFALAPAAQLLSNSARFADPFRASGRSTASVRTIRVLAVGEVALGSTVLVAALVLAQAFAHTLDREPGFDPGGIVTMRVSLPPSYDRPGVGRFYERVLDDIRALPGVTHAAAVTQLPLSGAMLGSAFLADMTASGERQRSDADLRGVSADYFPTMGIRVLQGRGIDDHDRAETPAVAVIDETLAKRLWPATSPIGRQLRWIRQPARAIEVVGVVSGVRHRGLEIEPRETVYLPLTQYARWTAFLTARLAGDASSAASAMEAAVHRIDPSQPVAEITTLDALVRRSLARPGFGAGVGGVLALLALILAAIGAYGLFAFAVSQRVRELAVRMAVGASPGTVRLQVLRDGLMVAGAGLAIGVPLSTIGLRAARAFALDVVPVSSSAIAVTVATLFLIVAGACWLPARRAARIQPATALRAE